MSDIAAFLLARYEADARIARKTLHEVALRREGYGGWESVDFNSPQAADHGQRWKPERVLRDIEAKRKLLEVHHMERAGGYEDCWVCKTPYEYEAESYPCDTLRILAEVYDQHADYLEEWRL